MSSKTVNIQTGIGPMTDNFINGVLNRVAEDDVKTALGDALLEPATDILHSMLQPYVYAAVIMFIIIVCLLIWIIYLLISPKTQK